MKVQGEGPDDAKAQGRSSCAGGSAQLLDELDDGLVVLEHTLDERPDGIWLLSGAAVERSPWTNPPFRRPLVEPAFDPRAAALLPAEPRRSGLESSSY